MMDSCVAGMRAPTTVIRFVVCFVYGVARRRMRLQQRSAKCESHTLSSPTRRTRLRDEQTRRTHIYHGAFSVHYTATSESRVVSPRVLLRTVVCRIEPYHGSFVAQFQSIRSDQTAQAHSDTEGNNKLIQVRRIDCRTLI